MRTKNKKVSGGHAPSLQEDCCALCRLSDDDPVMFGEKVSLKEHKLSVHYFCLLTSCGVYQRGEENEGVFGFLVDDIKREVRRAARLRCCICKKKGACVGCNVGSCRRTVHYPCGRKQMFISQFTGLFPSYCRDHGPSQSLSVGLDISLPQSCSICLDSINPVLSYSILKCPSCHTSWFHRDCVQHQAHNAGLFFFRCTLCNNKENFQEEMLRMGIYIPERDASWELEANAYSELLEVYNHCDSLACLCNKGRSHSANNGWFEVIRCRLCGSRGTHRKCAGLKVDTRDWACPDCAKATDGKASLVTSPQAGQRRSLLSKRHLSTVHSPISCKRPSLPVRSGSPPAGELLQSLALQLQPVIVQVEVNQDQVLSAALHLVRSSDFDPTHTLSVRFKNELETTFSSSLQDGNVSKQYFLKLLLQQIHDLVVFEGPCGSKNLALDSQALREDLYFDIGCLLALSLVHGGPPVGFFSRALYQLLFNHPANLPLTISHMTPNTHFTCRVTQIEKAESLDELREVMEASREYLELAGCYRPIGSLEEKEALVEDLVSFTMITRMQLPLQRFREGLQTLGVFDQVQLFPSVFCDIFCKATDGITAQTLDQLFTIKFSQQQEKLHREMSVVSSWRDFLLDCEVGRSSISLQDILRFATGADELPPAGLLPPPSISFLHHPSQPGSEDEEQGWRDEGLFPQSRPESRHLLLPITSSYSAFKNSMEQAISHHVHMLPSDRSYCRDHGPSQSLSVGLDISLPQSCSICLDSINPVLSYSILKCPSCHTSWFHRDCVQHQAHNAGLFFFRCTLCNNKENFQEEMLRMGIYIPERDASWELEANAYSELLEVYNHCDSLACLCNKGRSHSANNGWFEVIRCRLCGSRGTHRKCAGLKVDTRDWACPDCAKATDGKASLVTSPQAGQRRSLLSKRHLSTVHSPISCKRPSLPVRSGSPPAGELLQSLALQLQPVIVQVEVNQDQVLSAALHLVRSSDFDPTHTLSVRFKNELETTFSSSLQDGNVSKQYFLKLLLQQIHDLVVFEGPCGSKNLALDSQALREDLYFDIGCLLALSLVHGGPPVGFFSRALYQLLFNHPANLPLTISHMTPNTHFTCRVTQIEKAESLDELREVMEASREYLELAGCYRPISSLEEKEALVEDLVSFTMITRMQLPLQRFREGLQTLGVFDQVQLFPSVFCDIFCKATDGITAQTLDQLFTIKFSQQQEKLHREMSVVSSWRDFLLDCEVGRSSISLQDILRFATGADELPPAGLLPPPSISFLHHPSQPGSEDEEQGWRDEGLFPQSRPESRHLLLPITSSYSAFKNSMEQAVSHHVHMLPSDS